MNHLDPIQVEPVRLAGWLDLARGFGKPGEVLLIELTDFANDLVRHRARRAADAARHLAARQQGASKTVAETLATELDVLAES